MSTPQKEITEKRKIKSKRPVFPGEGVKQTPEATRQQICLPTLVSPAASAAMLWVPLARVPTGSWRRAISRLRKQVPRRLCNSRISDGTCTYLAQSLQISAPVTESHKINFGSVGAEQLRFPRHNGSYPGRLVTREFWILSCARSVNNNNRHSRRLRNILTRTEGERQTASRIIMMAFTWEGLPSTFNWGPQWGPLMTSWLPSRPAVRA